MAYALLIFSVISKFDMLLSFAMEGQKDFVAFARFSPEDEEEFESQGLIKVSRLLDSQGQRQRGQYRIEMPPGTGEHEVEIQLLGVEPRRYSLKQIDPNVHELRTFRYIDTPTMLEDTGFELAVSVKTLED